MIVEKIFLSMAAILWSAVFCLGSGKEELKKDALKPSEARSLIRKDLLMRNKEELAPPKRNIFSPQTAFSGGISSGGKEIEKSLEGVTAEPNKEASPVLFYLKYLGYIDSPQKVLGLVIFEEQVLSVEEGEELRPGIKVGKITAEDIEIIGPGSVKKKFSLEGEKQ